MGWEEVVPRERVVQLIKGVLLEEIANYEYDIKLQFLLPNNISKINVFHRKLVLEID